MEAFRIWPFVLCLSLIGILLCGTQTQARYHYHKPKHSRHHHSKVSTISECPSSSPTSIAEPPFPPTDPNDPKGDDSFFSVRKFGAVGDGITDDTEAFKSAWDAACSNEDGSSVVLAQYGFTFVVQPTVFAGPCKGNIVMQVDGTVVPPNGPELWPSNVSKRQWLVFYKINGMVLTGGGVIDGRGQKWWELPCKPHRGINGATMPGHCDSPIAMRFFMSSNLTVKGLYIKNSPQFNFRFDNCKNVHVESLRITAPPLSPNTDGIHIENSNAVGIYNSVISNGDDCVSIGSGSFNVDIRNITCGPSHGISIGSLGSHNSHACVSNITVRDSTIRYSDNGLRIKTWQGGSGSVSKVTFSNIHVENVRNPIIIDQYYCSSKGCSNQTSNVFVSDVAYVSIKGTYDVRSPAMHFGCSDTVPCTNLTLSDVELLPAKGQIVVDPFCWNAYGEAEVLTIPPVSCLARDPPTALLADLVETCH